MNRMNCQRCGLPLDANAGGSICPGCLLREALAPGAAAADGVDEAEDFPRPFGDYELLSELGRGGMGLVFRAWQPALDRIVALKTPVMSVYVNAGARRRFRDEVEAAAHLQHPNIVAIHEVGEVEGRPFFTMDLVDGPDLATMCDGRPVPPQLAAEYLHAIASAVAAAHAAGVLHCDLKPSNVLVGSDGWPRVTDFGLAKRADAVPGAGGTLTGQVLGSPSYMPPEKASGSQKIAGPAGDIYGLGAVLYHLVTGRAPFVSATAMDTLRLVLATEPVAPGLLNPALPRDLETICLKCLAKDPARRYATAADVADDLERFLENRPIRARPPSLPYRLHKFVQRHRVIVGSAAVVGLALVGGLLLAVAAYRRVAAEQRATDAARGQAEQLVGLLTREMKPALEQHGGFPQLVKAAEAAVKYYAALPAELRNTRTNRAHAEALAVLARLRGRSLNDSPGAQRDMRAALVLRERITRQYPDEPEFAAEQLSNEFQLSQLNNDLATRWSTEHQGEFNRRWQRLYTRYPASGPVRRGLAEFAAFYASIAAMEDKPGIALAAARQSRVLVEALVAERPDDPALGDLVQQSLSALSIAHSAAGDQAQAAAAGEQALAYCTAALQANPGNRTLRLQAAEAARMLSYRASGLSMRRARDAELIARDHYRILAESNPDDLEVRSLYAYSHHMESEYLGLHDMHRVNARAAIRKYEALLDQLPEQNWTFDLAQSRVQNSTMLALLAALEGNQDEARVQGMKAQARFEVQLSHVAAGTFDRRLVRVRYWQELEKLARARRDGSELTRLTQETAAEIDAGLAEHPDHAELLLRQVQTRAFRGIALYAAGRAAEAASVLAEALDALRKSPRAFWVFDLVEVQENAAATLIEAWRDSGDLTKARELGESIIRTFAGPEPEDWPRREWRARIYRLTAGLLGAGETARRTELLDHATDILTQPEAEGRITVFGREDLAMVAALRDGRDLDAKNRN